MSKLTLELIASAVGGSVKGICVRCPGPGHSATDDSLAIFLASGADGFTVHSFAGDSWQDCKEYVRQKLFGVSSFAGREHFERSPERHVVSQNKTAIATEIWDRSVPLIGTPAELYLSKRLAGLTPSKHLQVSDSLRFSAEQKIGGAIGALVALMRDPTTNAPTGVHLTYLDKHAANSRLHGRNLRGFRGRAGVVCFGKIGEVPEHLGIAEGLETALAASVLHSGQMVWATLSTAGLAKFPPLDPVKCLTIFADNDHNGAGLKAAQCAARAWRCVGVSTEIKAPAEPGADWNDVLEVRNA